MTANERLEILLNKAGGTLSDLPNRYDTSRRLAAEKAVEKHLNLACMADDIDYEDYICHLTDIIDELETALDRAIMRSGRN